MPRLQWLAPLRTPLVRSEATPTPAPLTRSALLDVLVEKFAIDPGPVLVATAQEEGGWLEEVERSFVVPDDWRARAQARRGNGFLPA
jgi:hypothetical protein